MVEIGTWRAHAILDRYIVGVKTRYVPCEVVDEEDGLEQEHTLCTKVFDTLIGFLMMCLTNLNFVKLA